MKDRMPEVVALCPIHVGESYVPHVGTCPEPGCHETLVEFRRLSHDALERAAIALAMETGEEDVFGQDIEMPGYAEAAAITRAGYMRSAFVALVAAFDFESTPGAARIAPAQSPATTESEAT